MTNPADLESLIDRIADKALPLVRLACLLLAKGQSDRARKLCERALALSPCDGEVQFLAAEVLSHDVPQWYFPMLSDDVRHKIYEAAFRRIIVPGCRVLDIGSGTGLFAMMAARAGAGEVVTCEARPVVAAAVADVIAHNGLAGRVRVVAKRSSDLQVGIDLGGPADVVVWDNLANNLIGAGALPSVEQTARLLIRPGAQFIPARGAIRVALAEDRDPQFTRLGMVEGFDMSRFNRLASPRYGMSGDREQFVLRSEAADLFRFDFASGGPFPESRSSVAVVATGGRVNCIAQWIHLELDDEVQYESAPPSYRMAALHPLFYALREPVDLEPRNVMMICGAHDRTALRLWINQGS